jgi:hypothetical protein
MHIHEYDGNWQCKCGFRLITEFDVESQRLIVKAYVTLEGKTVPLGEEDRETS